MATADNRPNDIGFNVYRASSNAAPAKLNAAPITNSTCYADTNASFAQKISYTAALR